MKELSIDIETLGTLVDSQILSIGMVMFDLKTGELGSSVIINIAIDDNAAVNATLGTLKFWISQAKNNPEALESLFSERKRKVPMQTALYIIERFVKEQQPTNVWANGTKFDLGMIERQFSLHNMQVPWRFNADNCMRTLRRFAGNIEVDFNGIAHNALSDAMWQAKYISAACNKLGLV